MSEEKRAEAAIQFEKIYEEHHSPEARELRKLKKNREQRLEQRTQDNGL